MRQKHGERKGRDVLGVPPCCWCISPQCFSYLGAAAAVAGCSPLVAAFSPGSPAASTLSHSAFSPYGRAAENTRKSSRLCLLWQLPDSWVYLSNFKEGTWQGHVLKVIYETHFAHLELGVEGILWASISSVLWYREKLMMSYGLSLQFWFRITL